jgi:hypothetical protein
MDRVLLLDHLDHRIIGDFLFPIILFPTYVHNFSSLYFDWLIESGRDSNNFLSKVVIVAGWLHYSRLA